MRGICGACDNADLEVVAFAGIGVSAIPEHVDLFSASRDAAMCLLGRLTRELAEATESHDNTGEGEPKR